MGRREQREWERKRGATSCKSIEHFLPVVKKSCSAQGQPSHSDPSSATSVHDSVQSSLAQNSTTCCTTSDIQASPTPSPVELLTSVNVSLSWIYVKLDGLNTIQHISILPILIL